MAELFKGWPDVPGGWQSYAHPSMLAPKAPEKPYDPIMEIVDSWGIIDGDGPTPPAPAPSTEPLLP